MLAVFSLREVELSRRIHCFLAGERERFYSILFPPPPPAFPPPPHPPAGSCNFPHRTFLFFIAYFFALYVATCILQRPSGIVPRRDELGRACETRELFHSRVEMSVFLAQERTWRSIEQKYARNSTPRLSPPSSLRQTDLKRSSFIKMEQRALSASTQRAVARNSTGHLPKGVRDDWVDRIYSSYTGPENRSIAMELPLSEANISWSLAAISAGLPDKCYQFRWLRTFANFHQHYFITLNQYFSRIYIILTVSVSDIGFISMSIGQKNKQKIYANAAENKRKIERGNC